MGYVESYFLFPAIGGRGGSLPEDAKDGAAERDSTAAAVHKRGGLPSRPPPPTTAKARTL